VETTRHGTSAKCGPNIPFPRLRRRAASGRSVSGWPLARLVETALSARSRRGRAGRSGGRGTRKGKDTSRPKGKIGGSLVYTDWQSGPETQLSQGVAVALDNDDGIADVLQLPFKSLAW